MPSHHTGSTRRQITTDDLGRRLVEAMRRDVEEQRALIEARACGVTEAVYQEASQACAVVETSEHPST